MRKTVMVIAVIVAIIATSLTVSLQASGQNYNIPNWIKNNAKWWSEGQIGDSDFISGIKYLIENDIMVIQQGNDNKPENVFNVPPPMTEVEPSAGYAIDYNVVFVTTDDNCTWEEFGKMHFYKEVTYYYLLAWGLEPTYLDPICLPNTALAIPEEYFGTDLTILILGQVLTKQHLAEYQHAWGYFEPPSLIVSGLLTQDDIASEWTLTHELAHFVLYYMGEPESVYADWVHNIEDWNQYCILQDPNDQKCNEIYAELEVNGMRVLVMRPYAYYGAY